MDWAHPERLWCLLSLPPLAGVVAWGMACRRRDWRALGRSGRSGSGGAWAWLLAVSSLIVALGQPRWGRAPGSEWPPGHDVVLLVDVSRSMGAEDAVPSRLGAAQILAAQLLQTLKVEPGPRVAVVAFAGRGVTFLPLTEALGAASEAVSALRTGSVRPGGTDLGAGLAEACEAFDDREGAGGRTVVLLTDGEDHPGRWEAELPRLRARGIVVHAVTLGNAAEGQPVPTAVAGPLRFRGRPVASRRRDEAPEAIARGTGGAFLPIGVSWGNLGALYAEQIAPGVRLRREARGPAERVERFPILLGLAALAAGWATWAEGRRGGRVRRFASLGLVGLLAGAVAEDGGGAAGAIERGRRAYGAGDFVMASAAFDEAIRLDPGGAVPRFDAAASRFRLGDFAGAERLYREARGRADAGLAAQIDFALGNVEMARGDLSSAMGRYDRCLAGRGGGAVGERARADARENRRFAEALLAAGREEATEEEPQADPKQRPEGGGGREPQQGQQPPGSEGGGEASEDSGGSQRTGGAGGQTPTPPRPGSPEARLAQATSRIREERRRREAAEVSGDSGNVLVEDW